MKLSRFSSASPSEIIPPNKLGYSINQVLDTGAFPTRNKVFDAIARGDITSWKDGRSRVISADSLRAYIERKTREAAGQDQLPKRAERQDKARKQRSPEAGGA